MTTLRIKRRQSGGNAGAPTGLYDGEIAYNSSDPNGGTLYFGQGVAADGHSAAAVVPIAGQGWIAGLISAAIAGLASLASPSFTGTPSVPTASPGTNTTQAASTAFVQAAVAGAPAPSTVDGGSF